jgi:hypothetical protein
MKKNVVDKIITRAMRAAIAAELKYSMFEFIKWLLLLQVLVIDSAIRVHWFNETTKKIIFHL